MRTHPTLLLLALAGCGDPMPEPHDTDVSPVTFTEVQTQVFAGGCGGAGCHDAVTRAGDLDLEADDAYDQLFRKACANDLATAEGLLRVVPGQVDDSFLYLKVTDPGEMGDPMPPFGTLSEDDVALIAQWIADGALP